MTNTFSTKYKSTKLTNESREKIIRVLVDKKYGDSIEKIKKEIKHDLTIISDNFLKSKIGEYIDVDKVHAFLRNKEETNPHLTERLKASYMVSVIHTPNGKGSYTSTREFQIELSIGRHFGSSGVMILDFDTLPEELKDKIRSLNNIQTERKGFEISLKKAVFSFGTTKQLLEHFPEMENIMVQKGILVFKGDVPNPKKAPTTDVLPMQLINEVKNKLVGVIP